MLPFVAYPPNPPAVGEPETIGTRTALYFIAGGHLGDRRRHRRAGRAPAGRPLGRLVRRAGRVGGYLVLVLVAIGAAPDYDEVPADFPATVLYEFRTASFVTQLALWAVLGVVLAELVHRLVRRAGRGAPRRRHWPDCPR